MWRCTLNKCTGLLLITSFYAKSYLKVMGEWGEKIPNLGVNQTIKNGFGIRKSF
ncbi:hypothetical protein MICAI_2620002 [Microcystis sp. T1-4]|nr:hypothetical protein MICAI_2620002 [Microcystis sp. T1-4]